MKKVHSISYPGGELDLSKGTIVMGILNVTPDSFSDGGVFVDVGRAVAHGIEMADAGAGIIDIGPESTRPGSEPVSVDEQIARAVPVIEKLAGKVDVAISIDTQSPQVARAALNAGATIINDISSLSDPAMGKLAAERSVPLILMHMQGTPGNMQQNPQYDDVVAEIVSYLLEKAKLAQSLGVDADKIMIDPGIGFGKTLQHNLELMRNIDVFVKTGYPVLVGASRKRFIGTLTGEDSPADRTFGTAATVAHCVNKDVAIVRVHDVPEMVDVVKVAQAISADEDQA